MSKEITAPTRIQRLTEALLDCPHGGQLARIHIDDLLALLAEFEAKTFAIEDYPRVSQQLAEALAETRKLKAETASVEAYHETLTSVRDDKYEQLRASLDQIQDELAASRQEVIRLKAGNAKPEPEPAPAKLPDPFEQV